MDAASLEQMNKLRKSLGLPLLSAPGVSDESAADSSGPTFKNGNRDGDHDDDDEDGEAASTLETREAAGFENFKQIQDEERKRIEREKRKKTIQRARELAARSARLEGKGLGEVDDGGDIDAKAWLKGQKKRQKGIELDRTRRLEEEIAEQERLAALEYTSKDLAGVQVAHAMGDFDDGLGEQILTLKDQEVARDDEDEEDDEGDVLENADLVAKDRLKEKLELKKKIAYDVHDTDKKELLSQYDEKKRKAFTLDATGEGSKNEEGRDAKRLAVGDRLKDLVSLDIVRPARVSDYMEVKIKKSKKSKKNKRQKADDDEDIFPAQEVSGDSMEIDGGQVQGTATAPSQATKSELLFNDDDDLASALSFSRRTALKKQKKKPSDLVRQLKEEQETEDAVKSEAEDGLTLNDTTTFLDNLAARSPEDEADRVQRSIERESPSDDERPERDIEMGEAIAVGEDEQELLERLAREQEQASTTALGHTGLDEEKSLNQGLGAALSMLRQRGLVKTETGNSSLGPSGMSGDRNQLHRDRATFISEAKLRSHESDLRARAQREKDRTSGKLANLSTREREEHARWQNTHREHQSSIAAAAAFNNNYKPDVELKYVDDDGRLMNAKEAFKHLSHKFHGKGSGKGKTEKHLKKVADEKRREARSVLDASAEGSRGYEGAASHQRKGGQAGVRLQ